MFMVEPHPETTEPAADSTRAGGQLACLQQIALALSAAHTAEQVADVIITEGLAALGGSAGSVALLSSDGSELVTTRREGYSSEVDAAYARYPASALLPNADAARTGTPLFLETEAERAARYPDLAPYRPHGGAQVALPLIVDARALGGLTLSFPTDRIFSEGDRAFLMTIGQLCAQALDRALLYDEAHREIDERRKAQKSLKESERRFRYLFDAAAIPMVLATVDGQHTLVNDAACEFLGYTHAEIAKMHIRDLAHPDDLPLLRSATPRVLSGEIGSLNIEHRFVRKDGVVVWGHDIVSAARDGEGTPQYLIVTVADITERKQIEEAKAALEREEQAVAEQQRTFLRDVLAGVTDGRLRLCFDAGELPETLTPQGPTIPLSKTSGLAELRREAVHAAAATGISEERQNGLMAATSEAGMNTIVHAGGGQGRVYASLEKVQVRVEDHGAGIALGRLPRAALEKGYTTAGTLGQGMKMMLQSVDRVYLLTGGAGTTVVIEQDRVAAPLSDFYL